MNSSELAGSFGKLAADLRLTRFLCVPIQCQTAAKFLRPLPSNKGCYVTHLLYMLIHILLHNTAETLWSVVSHAYIYIFAQWASNAHCHDGDIFEERHLPIQAKSDVPALLLKKTEGEKDSELLTKGRVWLYCINPLP